MADKSIKFEAQIDPKVSPKMEKMLKTYGQLTAKAFDPKQIKQYNKEFDITLKQIEKHVKLTKQQAEAMRKGPIEAMKEQERLFKRITERVGRAQAITGDTGYADRWLQRKIRSEGIDPTRDPDAYGMYAKQAYTRAHRRASLAQGDVNAGLEALMDRTRRDQDYADRRRMDKVSTAMALGAGVQTAAAAGGAIGDVFYGQSMRKAGFQSQAAGFAGQMYNEMTNGDYTGMLAMMRDPARFQEMIADARINSRIQQTSEGVSALGGMITGGAQTILGFGMMGTGAGAGLGAMNAMGGLGTLTASGAALGKMVGNARAGRTAADTASAAVQGLNFLKTLDPIQLRQFQELQGRLPGIAEQGALSGGGIGAYDVAQTIHRAGMAGGIGSYEQSQGIFRALRGATTNAGALATMGIVTQSPYTMGIGRETALGGIASLSRTGTSIGGAESQLVGVLRKAMALGIDDSRLKEAIITTLPQLVETASGRARGMAPVNNMMDLAAASARSAGRAMDLRDIEDAAAGIKIGGLLTSGRTGNAPLNVAMANATTRAARRNGLPADTGYAFQLIPNDRLFLNDQTVALFEEAGIKDPAEQERIIREIKRERAGAMGRNSGVISRKTSVQDTAMAANEGVSYTQYVQGRKSLTIEDDMAVQAMMNNLGKTPAQMAQDAATLQNAPLNPMDAATQAAGRAALGDAANRGSPLDAALSNPAMKQNLENAIAAASSFVKTLEAYSKVGDLDKLRDVPGLVNDVAQAINNLGTAAARFQGVPRVVPPTIQGQKSR